jgi:RNA polymerase sigma-70 factor, ECF subfamily
MKPKRRQTNTNKRHSITSWIEVQTTVAAYVHSVILNYHDSEDVIQNIAVVFANKFDQLDASRDLLPWVLKLAHYEVANYFRAQNKEKRFFDEKAMQRIEQAYQAVDSDADDVKAALHECIKKIHDRPRGVLESRYFEDMGIGDISRQQGVSQNAVRIMLYRVRNALANCVKRKTHIQWEIA